MAISDLFVGLYIEHICLGLFFLKSSTYGVSAVAIGAIMIILFVVTALTHAYFTKSFDRIITHIPISLTTKSTGKYDKTRPTEEDTNGKPQRLKATTRFMDDTINGMRRTIRRAPYQHSDMPDAEESMTLTEMTLPLHQSYTESQLPGDPNVTQAEHDHEDEHVFDHPSIYVDRPWIWIPKDPLGLSEILIQELEGAEVSASDMGAIMDERGIVEVTRGSPDEEWGGGRDN
ncbi:hypothetical protein AX15_007726 [Amanita polypyramis BW_CC]|nr:hypothetical protein AX15_007726 [Amanita polypyramis BW_CC]